MMGGKRTIIQVMEDPEEGKDQKMRPPLPPSTRNLPFGQAELSPVRSISGICLPLPVP